MTVLTSPGVAYGGTYGLAMATVLEAVPEKSRGVVASFTQQGFSSGYLFASGLHLAMSKLTVSPSSITTHHFERWLRLALSFLALRRLDSPYRHSSRGDPIL